VIDARSRRIASSGRSLRSMCSLLVDLSLLAAVALPLGAQADPTSRSWNEPLPPFRIAGNVYYVGAKEVTSYLVTTPAGHMVIDSGFAETAPQVLANIRTLGFDPKDVRWLLISHSHYDHVGGIADLRDATGARIIVSAPDAEQVRNGGKGDFAWGDRYTYRPFTADRIVHDGDAVALGDTVLTANVTPGHTRGCTTWTTDVVEEGKKLHVLFLCSVTVPGYRLVGNRDYPGILDDYRETIRRLAAMPVDVFLAAHGSFFGLLEKRAALAERKGQGGNPFVDPAGYRDHISRAREALERKVEEQRTAEAGH